MHQTDTQELNRIFRDLAELVIDQGTILDRIDARRWVWPFWALRVFFFGFCFRDFWFQGKLESLGPYAPWVLNYKVLVEDFDLS